jgi:hypothetical protein
VISWVVIRTHGTAAAAPQQPLQPSDTPPASSRGSDYAQLSRQIRAGPIQQVMGERLGHVSTGGVPARRLQPSEDRVEAGVESLVPVVGPHVLAEDSQDREPAGWQ